MMRVPFFLFVGLLNVVAMMFTIVAGSGVQTTGGLLLSMSGVMLSAFNIYASIEAAK